jgi:uncharacterized ParB-like nuclease family protein
MSALDNFIEVPIENLIEALWNYKEKDPETQEDLEENIRHNGQVENIIVRELGGKKGKMKYEVVNGNHRLQAFLSIGFKTVVCYNRGEISEAAAARIAIETNETKFGADNIKLAKLIGNIKAEFKLEELAKTMPYKLEELQNFGTLTEFNWNPVAGSEPDETEKPELGEGGAPEKGNPADKPAVKNGTPESRTINLKLPTDIAEMFEHQLKRIKKLLYPDQLEEHVSATLPIQAMLQIVAETDDSRFK